MECDQFNARVDEWVDGGLDAPDASLMESHSAACRECHRALLERRLIKRVVGAKFRRPEPAALFSTALASSLAAAARPRSLVSATAVAGVVAASVAILALIFFLSPGFRPRLTHADVALGSAEAFRTWCCSNPPPGTEGREACRGTLRKHLRLELGPELDELISFLRNVQFQGWAVQSIRGIPVTRVDFKPTAEGEDPSASLNCKDPLISVFLIPLASTRLDSKSRKALEEGHPCTRCAELSDGSLFCITSKGYLFAITSNLPESTLLRHHVRT